MADFERVLHTIQYNVPGLFINPLDHINYAEAGITRKELERWWKQHKKLDAQHREAERLKKLRESALSKLSEEERQVLGVS